MKTQKSPDSQNHLGIKKKNSWRYHIPWFQTLLQSYSNQNTLVLMSKQENRTEGPELNPYLHSQLTSDKRGKNIKRWERQLLQEMVFRKLYSYVWKNLTGLFFHIIYKNKVKIDSIPKYKIWNHKTPRR